MQTKTLNKLDKKYRYTDNERREIIALSDMGKTGKEIAKIFNCSENNVSRVLKNKEKFELNNLDIKDNPIVEIKELLFKALEASLISAIDKKSISGIECIQDMDIRTRKGDNVYAVQNITINVNVSQNLIKAIKIIDKVLLEENQNQ